MAAVGFHVRPRQFTKRRHFLPEGLDVSDQLSVCLGFPYAARKVPGVGRIRTNDRRLVATLNQQPSKSGCKTAEFCRVVGTNLCTDETVLVRIGNDLPCRFVMELTRAFAEA